VKKYYTIFLIGMLLYLFFPHAAQAKLIKSIGISGGMTLPQGGWDPGYTVGAQVNFGEGVKYLFISPYLLYSNTQQSVQIGQMTEDLSIQYISLGTKFIGFINSKPRGFYLGGSISYNIISEFLAEDGQLVDAYTIAKDNTTKVGYGALMGYLFTLKKFSIFIEANYMLVPGGYNNLQGLLGIDFNL